MEQQRDGGHWTHTFSVEYPELYLPFLQQLIGRAQAEVTNLTALFDRFGVPENGRVLDVACGIGRHGIPLAQSGYKVTGLDLSPLYVGEARKYAADAGVEPCFMVGDARESRRLVGDRAPFDAVINMFTSHGYYGAEADVELFHQLRSLARPGAVLVVQTANRDWIIRNFEPEGVEKAGNIRMLQRRTLDLETSSIANRWEFYEGEGESLELKLALDLEHRIYSLHELKAMLESVGWSYLDGLGQQDREATSLGPLTYDSKDMWVVARAV